MYEEADVMEKEKSITKIEFLSIIGAITGTFFVLNLIFKTYVFFIPMIIFGTITICTIIGYIMKRIYSRKDD